MPAMLASFLCLAAAAIDGDTLRCRGQDNVRLLSIDAPEMPGHCRKGRQCTPGDPIASRNNLTRIMRGNTVKCRPTSRDNYGRILAYCYAGSVNLSCAQVAGGFAVERYGRLDCR